MVPYGKPGSSAWFFHRIPDFNHNESGPAQAWRVIVQKIKDSIPAELMADMANVKGAQGYCCTPARPWWLQYVNNGCKRLEYAIVFPNAVLETDMGLLPNPWAYVNAWIPAVLWEYAAVLASKEQSHKPMTMNWRVEKASQSLNEVYLVSIPNIYVHTRMAFAVNCVAVELLIPSRSHVLGNEKQTRIWGSSYALPGLEHDIKVLTNNPFTGIKIRTSKICLKTPSVVLDTLTSLEVIGQTKGSNFGHRQSNSLERFCLNETVLGRCDQARTSPNFVNEYRYSGKSCAEQIKVLRRVHAQLDRCDEHQEAAIIGALSGCRHGLLVLDGPAGPGKTTTSAKCALCLTEIWKNVMVVMKSKIAADRIAEGIMLRFEKHGVGKSREIIRLDKDKDEETHTKLAYRRDASLDLEKGSVAIEWGVENSVDPVPETVMTASVSAPVERYARDHYKHDRVSQDYLFARRMFVADACPSSRTKMRSLHDELARRVIRSTMVLLSTVETAPKFKAFH
ncbi:hypothetical protein KJE20_08878 [Pyrenophora tritici-repentis]|nr:hypothetical protein KJE20_08878 [Pyrenophora tritici-repentis]